MSASILATVQSVERLLAHEEGRARHYESQELTPSYRRAVASASIKSFFSAMSRLSFDSVFINILRAYELPPAARREVEKASLRWGKTRISIPKDDEVLRLHTSFYQSLIADVALVKRVLAEGKPCVDNVCAVACFRVVNAGGFDAKTMETAKAVVDEGVRLLRQHHLDWLCYGTVNVTNTIYGGSKVLAFYDPKVDEMFIRANIKRAEHDALLTFLHELGHRLEKKVNGMFVRSSGASSTTEFGRAVSKLYASYYRENASVARAKIDAVTIPKQGDTFPINKGRSPSSSTASSLARSTARRSKPEAARRSSSRSPRPTR